MTTTHILYIGRNPEINQVMERLLNSHEGWQGTVVGDEEQAISLMHEHVFEVLLLGNGLTEAEEKKLRAIAELQHPYMAVIAHYGGGSGLLENEILEALDSKKPRVNYHDGL